VFSVNESLRPYSLFSRHQKEKGETIIREHVNTNEEMVAKKREKYRLRKGQNRACMS
jgi:hypothetical protein